MDSYLHLDALLLLGVGLLAALAEGGVDLLGRGLLRLLRPRRQNVVITGLLQRTG